MDSYVIGATTTVIILVTVLIFVGRVLQMRHEERKLAIEAQSGSHASNALWDAKWQDGQAEVARLKDRVAVLERLVTDEDRRIASEISRLQPSAEARG